MEQEMGVDLSGIENCPNKVGFFVLHDNEIHDPVS
jgi:hypothetical protein